MPIAELVELVKTGGGVCSVLLVLALLWMNKQLDKARGEHKEALDRAHGERKEALEKLEDNNEKLQHLSERTLVLLAEIKVLFGSR